MNKFNDFLENKVMGVAGRVASQRHLLALRDGMILTMPLVIIGSLFLILSNLPIPGYSDFMAGIFGDQWATKLSYPVGVTFDIMALIATFGIAYRLAQSYELDALTAGAISVSAFLLATPFQVGYTPEGQTEAIMVGGAIPTSLMGSRGLFVGMIIAMLSTEIYRWVVKKNFVIRLPDGVPPSVSKSFIALIPGFFVLTSVWVIRLIVEQTSFGSLHEVVGKVIGGPLGVLGGSLGGSIVAELVIVLLWVSGLHGANIVGGVMAPIWYGAMDENRIAFQNNEALPNIFTQQFFDNFINVGGSGATLALVICMILRARSKQMKQLGRLAAGPSLFNINEPIIFGMPVVLNPLLIIPFILAPVLAVITTYIGMSTGLVAKPAGIAVPWTMPPLLSGYLATGGKISGAFMQLFNIGMTFLIYYPFFGMWDKMKRKEEDQEFMDTEAGTDRPTNAVNL
ncbi:PTS cellobiose transporter subunit IIC [Paenibacillus sp. BR2-3]|uniref:PTS cellobiose transporter subunit IIC n=1 Tax=Paenibacillus sp. BR2-3 TaxID=3048494 RepID=UPI003977D854